jgi:iron complex outermembrane recepter protein
MRILIFFLGTLISFQSFSQMTSDSILELAPVEVSVTKLKKSGTPYSVGSIKIDPNLHQGTSINELTNQFSGLFTLSPNNYAQDARLSSRGFGARSAFGIRGIKIITDDLPDSSPDGQAQLDNIDFGSITSLELLRGPHAGIYGNNSGGVLNIYTTKDFDQKYFDIGYKKGTYGLNILNTGCQFSINKIGIALKYNYTDYDGYRQWSLYKNHIANAIVNYPINEFQSVKLILNYTNNPTAQDPGAINNDELVKQGRILARDRNLLFQAGENVSQSKIGFIYKYATSSKSNLVFKNYFIDRSFENKLPFENNGAVSIARTILGSTLAYDFSFLIKGLKFTNHTGIDYERQKDNRKQFQNLKGIKGIIGFDQNEIFANNAVYFLSNIELNSKLNLNANMRYDNIKIEAQDLFLTDENQSGKMALSNFNYAFSLDYKVNKSLGIGIIHSSGFESPTLNELSNNPSLLGGFNADLKPMKSKNLELNLKAKHKNNKFQLSGFYINTESEITAYELPMQNGRSFYRNAGNTTRTGIEIESFIKLNTLFNFNMNYTFSNFKYKAFLTFNGKKLPGLPDHMFNAIIAITPYKSLKINLENRYIGSIYVNDANSETVKNYFESNIKCNYLLSIKTNEITFLGGINNVFNQTYFSNLRINAASGRYYESAPDRNVYIGFNIRIK